MKKFLTLAVITIITFTASAQVEQGFRMGARINLGISNVGGTGDKATFGYGAAWLAEYNFTPKVYIQSGLGLENIAHKEEAVDGTINAYFLQLPIHAGYRFDIGETTKLFVQAGPTIGYGLFGSDIDWSDGSKTSYFDVAKRFDLALGGRIGVEFNKIQISMGGNYGVLDAIDVPSSESYHNYNINLGLAYFF